MTNPCEICVRQSSCFGREPCRRREAYERWKSKAAEIGKKSKKIY